MDKIRGMLESVISIPLPEADTEDIKAKNPGILEVPEGKHFYQMPLSHYISLAKKIGKPAVMRALLNLWRWNKEKASDISKKAKDIIDSLKGNSEWEALSAAEAYVSISAEDAQFLAEKLEAAELTLDDFDLTVDERKLVAEKCKAMKGMK